MFRWEAIKTNDCRRYIFNQLQNLDDKSLSKIGTLIPVTYISPLASASPTKVAFLPSTQRWFSLIATASWIKSGKITMFNKYSKERALKFPPQPSINWSKMAACSHMVAAARKSQVWFGFPSLLWPVCPLVCFSTSGVLMGVPLTCHKYSSKILKPKRFRHWCAQI